MISTDVGLIPQLFGEKQKKFVLEDRTCGDMIEAMKRLIDHSEMFMEISEENQESIQAWN